MRFPDDVPVLTDGLVTLRAHRESDAELLYETMLDPESLRWTAIPPDSTRADAQQFATQTMKTAWEDKEHRGWAIEAIDDDGIAKFAGNIDVRGVPIADVGFVLHPWARGRGIMSAALQLAANWSLAEGGVEIIHWRARVGNTASLRAAWAAGFTLHGTIPGFLYEHGQVFDVWSGAIRFGDHPGPRTPWHDSAVIEGGSLRLRPYRLGDVPRVVEACTDAESRLWLPALPSPYTTATALDYLNTGTWLAATGAKATWVVADADSDQLLADIAIFGLDGPDPTSGEIGYWTHPDARGRGVMTAATRLLVDHAFGPMRLRRLTLLAGTANVASNKVALGNGFELIGTEARAERLGDGSFADLNVYQRFP